MQSLILSGVAVAAGSVFAAAGYVSAPEDNVVRTGYGDCLHTARWSVENAIAECDPEIVAARDKPAAVAAVEIVRELNPISLQADALFAFDSADLTDEGRDKLDEVVGSLRPKALENKRIEITGYTDRIGTESYNQQLSERRAQAVRDYLVSKGLAEDAISTEGLGSSNPVVGCEGMRGDQLIDCLAPNRRTEIDFSAMEVIEVEKAVEVEPAAE
ncbi:MAG: OmpA family protein [Gammaproteobacteria bacterium]|jgi:OOP family OmpA-OmpF porin